MDKETMQFDFVVAGAGIAGMIAAVSAARKGLKVALLNDRSVLGGNASSEIDVRIQGAAHHGLNPAIFAKETGLVEELRQKLSYAIVFQGYGAQAAADAVFFDFIYGEPNISLYLNTVVQDVKMTEGAIQGLSAYQMKADVYYTFCAPLFADCTGDGIVAFKAGAAFMMGSEPQELYHETWAPEAPLPYTMGNSIYFEIEDTGEPVPFTRPAFSYDVSKMDFMKGIENPLKFRNLGVTGKFWTLEYGGQVDTIKDNEAISLELRKLAFGLWDYIKNSGKYPKAANYKLKRMYALAGTRESRRVIGDYVLTENDVENKVLFEDRVAMGGWPMDVHAPKGIYDDAPASHFISVTGTYSIPYRCLYARDVPNLFLAGRDISATHIAAGSTRVMATCGALGQAVGTAAALCAKHRVRPRELYTGHLSELQKELLRDDQSILGMDTRLSPELEQQFQIEASSVMPYENQAQEAFVPMQWSYGLALPLATHVLESVEVKLKNTTALPQTMLVKVLLGSHPETYLPDRLVKRVSLELEPHFSGWVSVPVDCAPGHDSKIYLVFEKNPAIDIATGGTRPSGPVTWLYHDKAGGSGANHDTCPLSEETTFVGQDQAAFNICFREVQPPQAIYAPDSLLDGQTRPYGTMHLWQSGPGPGQWITLWAKAPQRVARMHLLFDNGLDVDGKDEISPKLVRDYTVALSTPEGEKILEVRDNFQRLNVLEIGEAVSRIKIDFLRTYGADFVGLYAIKLESETAQELS